VSYVDAQERYRFNNKAYEQWLRLPSDEILGRTVREVWGEEYYARFKPNIERALRGERVSYEYAVTEGGVERHVLASYVPDLDGAGRVNGFFVLGSDVTQLAAAQRELAAQQARLEAALDGSSVALWETDLQNGRVYLSEAWAQMLGGPPTETVATIDELVALLHPDDVEPVRRASVEVMQGSRPLYAIEHRVRARDGEWKWILSRGRVTERDPASGRALRMIGTNYDITDRRRIEEAVQSAAQSDPLTGLANRLLLTDRLRLALARSARTGAQIAVLYLDIDRFKEINDRFGHAAGDALLRDFAARLRSSVRASDTVARFGGDEFVVLLDDIKEPEHAMRVAEKIVGECREPLRIEASDVVATTSIGLAFGGQGAQAEELLRRADAALYAA
jgi:diguanylate cyclase (GGDEF)-like protein/PAS domain S-box-containing protein